MSLGKHAWHWEPGVLLNDGCSCKVLQHQVTVQGCLPPVHLQPTSWLWRHLWFTNRGHSFRLFAAWGESSSLLAWQVMVFRLPPLNFSFVLVLVGMGTALGIPWVHSKGQESSSFP